MEKIKNKFVSNWRKILSVAFVLTVFMMPASKSIFAKFFNLDVGAEKKVKDENKPGGANTQSASSMSAPSSQSTASPMSATHTSTPNTSNSDTSNSNGLASKKENRPNPK